MPDRAPEAIWDLAMTPSAVRRLSPRDRSERALASFTRKVTLLEGWHRDGIPPGQAGKVPTDRAKLRRWEDASLRVWAWSDPQLDNPRGRNRSLVSRFVEAVRLLRSPRRTSAAELQRRIKARDMVIASLERQNADLICQIRNIQVGRGKAKLSQR